MKCLLVIRSLSAFEHENELFFDGGSSFAALSFSLVVVLDFLLFALIIIVIPLSIWCFTALRFLLPFSGFDRRWLRLV